MLWSLRGCCSNWQMKGWIYASNHYLWKFAGRDFILIYEFAQFMISLCYPRLGIANLEICLSIEFCLSLFWGQKKISYFADEMYFLYWLFLHWESYLHMSTFSFFKNCVCVIICIWIVLWGSNLMSLRFDQDLNQTTI